MSRVPTFAVILIVAAATSCGGPAGSGEPAATGTHRWSDQFGTPGLDLVVAAAAGPGGLVVVGQTSGDLEGPLTGTGDVYVRAFDVGGNEVWTRQIGSSESQMAHGVGIDAAGVITVVGHTWGDLFDVNQGGRDAFVWRLSPTGVDVSTEQFSASAIDIASGVAVAPSGAFVVVGMTAGVLDGVNAGGRDAFVRWYDGAGALVRTRQFGTVMNDAADAVALDGAGNAYVLGSTRGVLDGPHAGESDVFLRAFDPDGDVLWGHQFGTAGFDTPEGVAAHPDGIVYLTGTTGGALDGPLVGSVDTFIRSYDATGALRWATQFGATPGTAGGGIAVDAWQNVIVVGSTAGDLEGASGGAWDAFVRKLDGGGNVRWTRQFGSDADDFAEAVAVAADGSIYVAGNTEGDVAAANAGGVDVFVRAFTP